MRRFFRALSYFPPLVLLSDTLLTLHSTSDGIVVILRGRYPPKRGELAYVTAPDNSANRLERLIALPGDHVLCEDGVKIVPNGFVWLEQYGKTPVALIGGRAWRWLGGPIVQSEQSDKVFVPDRPYS